MRFKTSSTANMTLMERKKNKQSSSCMASFFNFFAKRKFFSSEKKFLPPIRVPEKSHARNSTTTNPLLQGRGDETETSSTQPRKKRLSLVARLMGLKSTSVKHQAVPIASEPMQNDLSPVPDPSLATETVPGRPSRVQVPDHTTASQSVQINVLKPSFIPKYVEGSSSEVQVLDPISASKPVHINDSKPPLVSRYVQEKSSQLINSSESLQKKVTKPINASETVRSKVYKASNEIHNHKVEDLSLDPCPTRPVNSPPRTISPINNVKLLDATTKILDIGSHPVMSRFVNPEAFGSKLNDALMDLDELKDNASNNSSSICNSSVNTNNSKGKMSEQVGGKSGTKRDVSPKRGLGTSEIKRDSQKGLNRNKLHENIPSKSSLKQGSLKQNKSEQGTKDFIALNRHMLNKTALRKKYLGLEKETENVKKVNKKNTSTSNSNNNNTKANAIIEKMEGVNEKRVGKELLIRKGAGQVSEKPPAFKTRAKSIKGEDMCIVSFTFSSPMKHKHAIRDFSRVHKEESVDSGVARRSSGSASQNDGKDSFSSNKSAVTVLQGPSLSDSLSKSSNGISGSDMKETSANKTEQKNVENEITRATSHNRTNINSRSYNISSSKFVRNKFRYSEETESKIQLFLQNILALSSKDQQVSSFVNDTTKAIMKTLYISPNNSKEENLVQSFITEHLNLVQNRVLNCGYNTWRKLMAFNTKEKLVNKIEKDISGFQNLGEIATEILVEKDMENWEDLGVNFEIGVQIEKEIISQLIGEIVTDILV